MVKTIMRTLRGLTAVSVFIAPLLLGQTTPQQPPQQAQQPFTIKVQTQLVVETVTVKDKDGKSVDDLTAKDFAITEDGVPQTISVFEYQRLTDDTPVQPVTPPAPAAAAAPIAPVRQITPERPGDIRYRDRRLLVLYFDMSSMPESDQLRALFAARKFLEAQMKGPDLVAVLQHSSGAVKVLQDFTDNRELLQSVIDTLIVGDDSGFGDSVTDASAADTGSAFGQDDSEFNLFNTDRQLAALQTAVSMLGTLNEKKSLVYFASGLRLNGIGNQAQLHATVNAAVRANVSFYPIDARGLIARAPLGDATMASPGTMAIYNGMAARAGLDNFQRSQDTLYALAADTGGKAMLDTNDLSQVSCRHSRAWRATTSSAITRQTRISTGNSGASRSR